MPRWKHQYDALSGDEPLSAWDQTGLSPVDSGLFVSPTHSTVFAAECGVDEGCRPAIYGRHLLEGLVEALDKEMFTRLHEAGENGTGGDALLGQSDRLQMAKAIVEWRQGWATKLARLLQWFNTIQGY